MNTTKVLALARIIRRWCEQQYPKTFGVSPCRTKNKDLEGMCGVASFVLFKELANAAGIESSFMSSDHHSFLVVGDSLIDLTARQFNPRVDKIFVHQWPIKKKLKWMSCYDNAVKCDTVADIKKVMQETWWSDIDNPIVFFETYEYPSEEQLAKIEEEIKKEHG